MKLYRGVNVRTFNQGLGLVPKVRGGTFATTARCGDPHAASGSGITCGESEQNTVIGHQWMQNGMPTQGLSTSPYFERARFYALDGGKGSNGTVYEIDVDSCTRKGVTVYRVSTEVPFPDVPEDDEHLLVAADCGPLPKDIVVKEHKVSTEDKDPVSRYLKFGGCVVLGGLVMYLWLLFFRVPSQPNFGQIGDAMAPFTALLSAAALFAAVEGVRLQSKELKLQRDELKLQREDLAESREVMREQADAAKESAKVQKQLVKAQEDLAHAQRTGNVVACMGHQSGLLAAMSHIETRIADAQFGGDGFMPDDSLARKAAYETSHAALKKELADFFDFTMGLDRFKWPGNPDQAKETSDSDTAGRT